MFKTLNRFRKALGIGVHIEWGCGYNENANRLIRRWFPKGTDFSKVTAAQIAALQDWINNYPRKVLNWSISNTVFGKFTIAAQPFHFSMDFAVSPVFCNFEKENGSRVTLAFAP